MFKVKEMKIDPHDLVLMDQGWKAFEDSLSVSDNPYESGSNEYYFWYEGWSTALESHIESIEEVNNNCNYEKD